MRSSGIILIILLLALSLAAPMSAYTTNTNISSTVDVPWQQTVTRNIVIANNESDTIYIIGSKSIDPIYSFNLKLTSGVYNNKLVKIPAGSQISATVEFSSPNNDLSIDVPATVQIKKAMITAANIVCNGDGITADYFIPDNVESTLYLVEGDISFTPDPGNAGSYVPSMNYATRKVTFTPTLASGDKYTVNYKVSSGLYDEKSYSTTVKFRGQYSNEYQKEFKLNTKVTAGTYKFEVIELSTGSYAKVKIESSGNIFTKTLYVTPDATLFNEEVVPSQMRMACTDIVGNNAYITIFSKSTIAWDTSSIDPGADPQTGDTADMLDWWSTKVFGGATDQWWSVQKWWGDSNPPTNLSDYIDTNLIHKTYLTTNYYDRTTIDQKLQQYTPGGGSGVVGINDGTTTTSSTWSSSKIATQFNQFDVKFNGYVTRDEFNARLAPGGNSSSVDGLFVQNTNRQIADLYTKVGSSSFFGTGIPTDYMIVACLIISILSFILGRSSSSKAFSPEFQRDRARSEQDRERVQYGLPSRPGSRFNPFSKKPTSSPGMSLRPQQPQVKPKQPIDLTERPDIEKEVYRAIDKIIEEKLNGKAKSGE